MFLQVGGDEEVLAVDRIVHGSTAPSVLGRHVCARLFHQKFHNLQFSLARHEVHGRPLVVVARVHRRPAADQLPQHLQVSPCCCIAQRSRPPTRHLLFALGGRLELRERSFEHPQLLVHDGARLGALRASVILCARARCKWTEGRLGLAAVEFLPVKAVEEGMALKLVYPVRPAAHALVPRHAQQAVDQVGGIARDPRGHRLEMRLRLEALNQAVQVVISVVYHQRLAHHHLAHEQPQRPPVNRGSVVLLEELLWREERGRADERHEPLARFATLDLFGQPEIGKHQVSVRAHQHVLGLEVAVHVAVCVHRRQTRQHTRAVKADRVLTQDLVLLPQQEGEELAA
mmetsp:Transcript_10501/g.26415  ORF Transcript_10501/g.26415 Transcript_10501/m.26415 type:complete len:344 (+) Transcript_10501:1793-2824(+)